MEQNDIVGIKIEKKKKILYSRLVNVTNDKRLNRENYKIQHRVYNMHLTY